MGLKGLKKSDRPNVEKDADEFIKGANERTAQISAKKNKKEKTFVRYTFSLNPEVSEAIDSLVLIPRDFRVNRSEVIKAAINMLSSLSEEEIIKILMQVK